MSKIDKINSAKISAKKIEFSVDSRFKVDQEFFKKGLGYFPFIWYNEYQMDTNDIEYCELSIVDCLPQIKVIFRDVTALSNNKKFPTDDTKISLFLNSRSKNLNPIHLDFKIIDFRVFKGKINCTGVIDVSSLYLKQFKSYSNH